MNNKISDIQQKRAVLLHEGKKKMSNDLESWVIEEYFIPYQAS